MKPRPTPVHLLVDRDEYDAEAKPLPVGRFALRVLDARRSHDWVENLPRRAAPAHRRRRLWRCGTQLYEQDEITGEVTRDDAVLWPGAAPVGCAVDSGDPVAAGSSVTLVFATRFAWVWELRVVRTPRLDQLWSLPRLLAGAPLVRGTRWISLARHLEARWRAG